MPGEVMDAQALDQDYQHQSFRNHFLIPTRGQLRRQTLAEEPQSQADDQELCTYLCGNSLGVQPKLTKQYFDQYLTTWATKGVFGHFKPISDSQLPPWVDADDSVQAEMATIVGARASEVAVMQTLTANIHLLFASFYKPTPKRFKIIIEEKAFPSDHYAIESQIRFHGLDPAEAMVLVRPHSEQDETISLERVKEVIDQHASQCAILWLPGVQFYTGQLFKMAEITRYAQNKGILVGWDLAHAVANVPLELHDWNVDFAAWCTYKYMNCGPGAIGGAFIHDRHFERARLTGWWGSSKTTRFAMTNVIEPIRGAAGFQLSNPSIADLTAVRASLDTFKQTSMQKLRDRSLLLTNFLLRLLVNSPANKHFSIITPATEEERGAQISIKLRPGLLLAVMEYLEEHSIVVDERKPDVIRVAPAPLYNNFADVERFVVVFSHALKAAAERDATNVDSLMASGGVSSKGWSEVN